MSMSRSIRETENAAKMETGGRQFLARGQGPFWRRHPWLMWTAGVLLVLLIAAAVAISMAIHRAEPFLRARLVAELQQRFHARVELDSFHVSLMNGLWAEGKGLRIWPPSQAKNASGGAPLIRLDEFRFHAPLRYRPGKPVYISLVELRGLNVDVPPKFRFSKGGGSGNSTSGGSSLVSFSVGTIECTNARLALETDKPDEAPLVFAIARLKLTGVGQSQGVMGFNAELTNPRPPGTIYTHGRFGPWAVDDPGESPIDGSYRFEHADLASFRGIAGTLSSTGNYEGTLRNLIVDGDTDTPDFRLSSGGQSMHLRTHFHARVDGTTGDTWLEPVDATLGKSQLRAKGKVVRVGFGKAGQSGQPAGHDVALTVNVFRGRIEDFLRLAAQGDPLLNGALKMQTSLEVPPGNKPVSDRLRLKGSFSLDDVQFTNAKMQNRIDELSLRGQGKPQQAKSANPADVRSDMQSDFQMANGVITLPNLQYTVPGAQIDLSGTYGVTGGKLNFKGTAKMQATVSEMVGGWKGLLLTPLDRFFKHGQAGTVLPVLIKGTRKVPQFTVDFGSFKRTVPERPGDSPGAT
jgi:hypothetical protein